jgi:hypothetical protein
MYTSRSLVNDQQPSKTLDLWGPVILEDYEARLATVQQQVLAGDHLPRMIERIGIAKPGKEGGALEKVRRNMRVEPALAGTSKGEATASGKHAVPLNELLGFYVIYTDSSPRRAQQVCDELTSVLLSVLMEERRTARIKNNDDTRRFLESQVEYAKDNLKTMHDQLVKHDRNQKLASEYKREQDSYRDLTHKLEQVKGAAQAESELKSESDMTSSPASLPSTLDFPNRLRCAGAGLVAGLLLGIGLLFVM